MILWGIPGAGKSTFARWLADHKGFTHAETDQGAAAAIQHVAAAQPGQPVVWEYGMWVQPDTVETVHKLKSFGAEPLWFDGDRHAAFQAWRNENITSNRPYPDQLWRDVVQKIIDNWLLVEQLFGPERILRTIESGPTHISPETIYATTERVAGK